MGKQPPRLPKLPKAETLKDMFELASILKWRPGRGRVVANGKKARSKRLRALIELRHDI